MVGRSGCGEAVALADRVLLVDQQRIAFDAAVP